MLCACIDIGTNTTRVLVADARGGRLIEVLQRRAFTRLGPRRDEPIPAAEVEEIARVVAEQRELAERAGASRLLAVATAAIRRAPNQHALLAAVRERGGVDVRVLAGEEEARLAFLGATRTLTEPPAGCGAVVDVGGGSTEIAVGTVRAGVTWCASAPIGSGLLTELADGGDPPSAQDVEAMGRRADEALAGLEVPAAVDWAVAVGGSAASLPRLVGPVLDSAALDRALGELCAAPAEEVARRRALDPRRVRLLPAGILVLDAAGRRLGRPLRIGSGGLREGVVLELAAGRYA
jgi:exopolyphosphatase/guanosine-5'-triphosphate,3'-diphosphate pyrophosphatase